MLNYRDEKPNSYKDLNSDAILAYFEDERASEEEVEWIREVLSSDEFKSPNNPISKWNWGRIKTAFAKAFFPDIAVTTKEKPATTEERIHKLLGM